jgi:hypothetical protein
MPTTLPTRRQIRIATGDLSDPGLAVDAVDQQLPPTSFESTSVAILDLSGKLFSPVSLTRAILTLGQRLRGGVYGNLKLVVVTSHTDIRDLIDLLARQHDLPLFLADSPQTIDDARPAGFLTETERETLDELKQVGGYATVATLAGYMEIAPTAVNNRLVNVERKGYIYRVKRGRRQGDLFIDPRTSPDKFFADAEVPPMRHALLSAAIRSDPYDTSPTTLEGEGAERAAEILRRRQKAD